MVDMSVEKARVSAVAECKGRFETGDFSRTLADMFYEHVKATPNAVYLESESRRLTYLECDTEAGRVAASMVMCGLRCGDRVALAAGNSFEQVVLLHACFALGVIAVPLNSRSTAGELATLIRKTQCKAVLVRALDVEKFAEACELAGASDISLVVTAGDADSARSVAASCAKLSGIRVISYDEVASARRLVVPAACVKPDDIAMLQQTGGTTGTPKTAALTNRNLVAAATMMRRHIDGVLQSKPVKSLVVQPLYHIMGFINTVGLALVDGGTLAFSNSCKAPDVLNAIAKLRPNYFAAVPTLLAKVEREASSARVGRLDSLDVVVVGGSPLPEGIARGFKARFGVRMLQGYGMSEVPVVAMENGDESCCRGGVGSVLAPGRARIVDVGNRERDVAIGQAGELLVRGPQVAMGYFGDARATCDAMKDGWFATGDIVMCDEDGYMTIVGRKKEMIVSSGFNVYPAEIDDVLYRHPAVLEACTVSVPHPDRVEVPKAYVVLKEGRTATVSELVSFCRQHLVAYKVPKQIEFVEDLPKTSVGKPDRRALARMSR